MSAARVRALAPKPEPEAEEKLLLVGEAAEILRISPREVARLIGRRFGEHPLPVLRIGRLVRVRPATLRRWIIEEEGL